MSAEKKQSKRLARAQSRRPQSGRPQFSRELEQLEARRMLAAATATVYRSIDGSGNNLQNPTWGEAGQPELRIAPAAYADGIDAPAGADRPSAREISNDVMNQHQAEDIFNAEGMSAFSYGWGQFIDHDMDLSNDATPAVPFNIAVPDGDGYFDPNLTGDQVIDLNRSEIAPGTGVTTPAQQVNAITAFIDASNIYGSDPARAAELRTFKNGMLKTTDNGTEPMYNTDGFDNETLGGPGDDPTKYFLAGDIRANENSELTSIQVLFVREHNRLAGIIQKENKKWTDEQVYQEARRLVIGEIQNITYNEFLPSILGAGAIPAYTGYNPKVNPEISNEFATAAYRFGHSLLGNDVQFFDDDANTTLPDEKLPATFFAPDEQLDGGTDGLLKYLAAVSAQENDPIVVTSIRNFLFGEPGQGGFDLASLDIQRGRDHGLGDYNSERAALGLPKVTSFSQITSNPSLAYVLQSLYGSVDNVDLFVGGMCEDHQAGSVLGPTFQRILVDQFTRTRDGDRFWFQRDLSGKELKMVENTTLSDVIKNNTTITNIQPDAFIFNVTISGRVWDDLNGNGKFDKGEQPVVGQVMQLFDGDGIIQHPVLTDANGNYEFTEIQVGTYTETIQPPDGYGFTTKAPAPMVVNTSIQFKNVNFGVKPMVFSSNPPPITNPLPITTSPGGSVIGTIGSLGAPKGSPIDDLLNTA